MSHENRWRTLPGCLVLLPATLQLEPGLPGVLIARATGRPLEATETPDSDRPVRPSRMRRRACIPPLASRTASPFWTTLPGEPILSMAAWCGRQVDGASHEGGQR